MMIETGHTTRNVRQWLQLYDVALWYYATGQRDIANMFMACATDDNKLVVWSDESL